jgi:putative Holliday junction resolvase
MILGVDPGERRVGLAVADLETRFARPLEVIDRQITDAVDRIQQVVVDLDVSRVVVGRPVTLAGIAGPAAEAQKSFLDNLRAALDVDVDVYDERMTTVIAEKSLLDAGASRAKRKAVRDAVAAQVMLQGYMDSRAP